MDDETLRRTIAGADPARHPAPGGRPVDPAAGPMARALVERIMTSPIQTPATPPPPSAAPAGRRARWLLPAGLAAGAAAVTLAVTVGTGLIGGQDTAPVVAGPTIELVAAPSDLTAMCMVFDPAVLEGVATAFEGTVTSVEADAVVLDVVRWYRGGGSPEAAEVRVVNPGNETAGALDGTSFAQGETYLVSAGSDGQVAGCGMTGPASDPTLAAAFASVFGS